jgi:hypothetical protein
MNVAVTGKPSAAPLSPSSRSEPLRDKTPSKPPSGDHKYTPPTHTVRLPILETIMMAARHGAGHVENKEVYSWDTSFGLVIPFLRNPCGQVVFCVNLDTFCKCFLQLG